MRKSSVLKDTLFTFITEANWWRRVEDWIFESNNRNWKNENYFISKIGSFEKTSDYAVILHLYYFDNWDDIFKAKLKRLSKKLDFNLYISLPDSNTRYMEKIRKDFPNANFLVVPNHGRDVLPFIKVAALLKEMGYVRVLKVHSKKSVHRETSSTAAAGGGDVWLANTLNALIPESDSQLSSILQKISEPNTGLIGAQQYYYPLKMYLRYNRKNIERIIKSYVDTTFFSSIQSGEVNKTGYFGGTMFWVDLDTISEALSISKSNFPKEKGQFDRTTAHALERIFCILPQLKGRTVYGTSEDTITKIEKGQGNYPDWYFDDVSGGKPQISIIVPVYGDWSSLSKNISSLKREVGNSEDISVHYVNDCGPEADKLEILIKSAAHGLTNFYYYRNPKNLGFVKSCNRAVLQLVNKKDDVLLLNSDTKVTRGFIAEMRKTLYSEPDIGAVTARSNNATIWSVPMTSKLAHHRFMSFVLYNYIKHRIPEKYITPTVHGFCLLIRREVIDQYKLFDEVYGKGYGEENDFAMRIQRHGWKCAVSNRAFVFHYESRSFGNEERNRQIEQNEKILLERYPEYRVKVQEYWDKIQEPLK